MTRGDIDALNTHMLQALEKGDAAAIAAVYAPDGQAMPPGAPVVTGPDIEAFWQGVIDMGVTGGALKTLSLEELGDTAIETGQYEMQVGGDVVDRGKYVVIHRKQPDGSWRFGTDIWNSDQASAPA
jgi:uncharacterized protein (TIGR02246 family)